MSELNEKLIRYKEIIAYEAELKKLKVDIKKLVLAEGIDEKVVEDVIITITHRKGSEKIDTKALKVLHPEIAKKLTVFGDPSVALKLKVVPR